MNTELIAIFTKNGLLLEAAQTKSKQFYVNDRLLSEYKSDPYKAMLHFGFKESPQNMSQSLSFLHQILRIYTEKLTRNPDVEITKSAEHLTLYEIDALLRKAPFALGTELINSNWLSNLWDNLSDAFQSDLSEFDGNAVQYLLTQNSNINIAGKVFFHLVENRSPEYPFAFLATYSRKDRQSESDKAEHVPLKNALLEYKDDQNRLLELLATVSHATGKSEFISELVESGELFSPLRFTADEAYTFLKEIPTYEECGIMCRVPDWWKRKYNTLRVNISIGEKPPSEVGMDALLSLKPLLMFAGEEITREEINALLAQTEGLSFLKGKWVEVDHEKLKGVLNAYDKACLIADNEGITFAEAMRMQIGMEQDITISDSEIVGISNGQWLQSSFAQLKTQKATEGVHLGKDFQASLRQYQQQGLNWMSSMRNLGFGALLADDMGLGKTVQVLALLESMREKSNFNALLIIPASLIGNWCKEIKRFTPKLRYCVLHGKSKDMNLQAAEVFITTYAMASKLETLRTVAWDLVILDEAQAIKNPATKQTKAIKAIPAKNHLAMTGTPVENRLSDLWSIFDFINPGLLGTAKEFSSYAKKLQERNSYAKLRAVINPFILRRLKTDKTIIADLPDKLEIKNYVSLSKKQTVLYRALVKNLQSQLLESEGIARKGVVLASIMKFKQICNHPDQYLGQEEFDDKHSGKFQMLAELCETIREKHERVLVFTQFREMCEPLSNCLEIIFGKKGFVLHGATAVKKRAQLVDRFNGDEYVPYMVLSLKAGGVGLNLTAANHVIHFDRWWNPAVENQATDRAFRIGQEKEVLVHKFVAAGTIEEKIDKMIEDKLTLSGELIAENKESWITEMNNTELLKLFSLEV